MWTRFLWIIVALWLPNSADAATTIWPGFFMTNRSSEGLAIVYMFEATGSVTIYPMFNGKPAGQMNARCKNTGHGFSCRFLDKSTGKTVTTKSYSVGSGGKNFTQRDVGIKACKVSEAQIKSAIAGRNIRACR
jgi:hypothetical protein